MYPCGLDTGLRIVYTRDMRLYMSSQDHHYLSLSRQLNTRFEVSLHLAFYIYSTIRSYPIQPQPQSSRDWL
jgi:hypothetical protein